MHSRRMAVQTVFLGTISSCFLVGTLLASEDESPTSSGIVPYTDLLAQLDSFIERVEESLSDPAGYDLAKQSRTLKDANTLAAIGLVLGTHSADFPEKASMPSLVKASQDLATAEADAAAATQALNKVKAARQGKSPGGEMPVGKVASLPLLMKQVPLIHAALKRGVTPRRLQRMAEQSAEQSAALAAIAEASILDDEYASDSDAAEQWRKYCREMRNAAGEINAAVHAQDQMRVDAAMTRLLESCENCHAKFR